MLTLWIMGYLFTAGIVLGDEDFEDFSESEKAFGFFVGLLAWPLILGLLLQDKYKKATAKEQ